MRCASSHTAMASSRATTSPSSYRLAHTLAPHAFRGHPLLSVASYPKPAGRPFYADFPSFLPIGSRAFVPPSNDSSRDTMNSPFTPATSSTSSALAALPSHPPAFAPHLRRPRSSRSLLPHPRSVALDPACPAPVQVVTPSLPETDDASRLHTVNIAIWSNVMICAAKMAAFMYTGSSAMLAESVHSVVDVANQYLLRVGLEKARRGATADHPYGYLKDQWIFSLITGVGIFCFGGGVSILHGFSTLHSSTAHLEHIQVGLGVLGLSFVVEGYSLLVATRHLARVTTTYLTRQERTPRTVAAVMVIARGWPERELLRDFLYRYLLLTFF